MGETTKFCRVAVSDLIPYINNAKIHTEDQITRIASSIREFGFLNPVLIDASYNVIAGHGRILAAKKLGLSEVPCLYVEGLTEAQRKAYILADNRLGELGEWDMNLVGLELGELELEGFDTDLLGFDSVDLDEEYGTDFVLPDGDKSEICQITFTLHEEQAGLIRYAMSLVEDQVYETFGNTNKNGNALYEVVRQWAEQRK